MSSSRQFSGEQRQRKAANFSQTCNLLSRYIKEKGSFRDLNLEIDGKVASLESLVKLRAANSSPVSASPIINALQGKGKSAGQDPSINTDLQIQSALTKSISNDAAAAAAAKDPAAPLTIFYSGTVLVFDDYPANKAKELLALAKKGSSQISYGISSNTLPSTPTPISPSTVSPTGPPPPPPPPRPESNSPIIRTGISSNPRHEKITAADPESAKSSSKSESQFPQQIEANTAGLRIARRSSIHKFLTKRKDRAAARGPYHQIQGNQQASSSSKGDEHLDLRL